MKPVSPVFPGVLGIPEVVYAKDQPEYHPLPAYRDNEGIVTARWHMDWRERLRVLWTGDVYVSIKTFNMNLQPSRVSVEPPEV